MLTNQFKCPQCQTALRLPTTVTAGQLVRCPQCMTTFSVPSGTEGLPRNEPAAVDPGFSPDEFGLSSARSEGTTPGGTFAVEPTPPPPRPVSPPSPRRLPEYDSGHPTRWPGQKSGGMGAPLILLLVVLALGVVGGVGYFLWTRFAEDDTKATPAAEMEGLAFLPADCNIVAGVDIDHALQEPEVAKLVTRVANLADPGLLEEMKKKTGLDFKDLDHLVVGGDINSDEATVVLKTKVPYDREKILKAAEAGPGRKRDGKEYFALKDAGDGPGFLYFPTPQIIVMINRPENKVASVLGLDGKKPQVQAETMTMLSKGVGKSHVWMVMRMDAVRNQLPPGMPPEMAQAKTMAFWGKAKGEKLEVAMGVQFADNATARRFARDADQTDKKKFKEGFRTGFQMAGGGQIPAEFNEVLEEVADNLDGSSKDEIGIVTTKVKFESLNRLINLLAGPGN